MVYLQVEITIQQTKEDTKITIFQRGVPVKEVNSHCVNAWRKYTGAVIALKRVYICEVDPDQTNEVVRIRILLNQLPKKVV